MSNKIITLKEFEQLTKDRQRMDQMYALLLAIHDKLDDKPKTSKSGGK